MYNVLKNKQRGFVGELILGILFFLFLGGYVLYQSDATSNDISAVVNMSKGIPEAEIKVKNFFLEHPTPTKGELSRLDKEINKLVVLTKARSITGNPNLKSGTEIEPEKIMKEDMALEVSAKQILLKESGERSFTDWMTLLAFMMLSGGPIILIVLIFVFCFIKFILRPSERY